MILTDKHQLKEYISLGAEIQQLEEEIIIIQSRLLSAPSPKNDGMPRGSKPYHDSMAEAVAGLVDLVNILQGKIELYRSSRAEIERAIDVLDSADRLLMRLRYIEGRTWENIAEVTSYSTESVFKKHKEILKRLQ